MSEPATGFSLPHHAAFAQCPSLPELRTRLAAEHPDFIRWGIHILVSQNGAGEVILGDSHQYGLSPEPFDRMEIDSLILAFFPRILHLPSLKISRRWHGYYATHGSKDVVVEIPVPDVIIVTGLAGAGMTLSFALAEETLQSW